MKARLLVALLLIAGVAQTPAQAATSDADNNRYIVRIKDGLDGLRVIQTVCALVGCDVIRGLDADVGGSLFLVDSALPLRLGDFLTFLMRLLGVVSAEPDLAVNLPDNKADQESAHVLDASQKPATFYGASVKAAYLSQTAVGIIRLREAQCSFSVTGAGIVAVIDTGVDPSHPALSPALLPGYDFTRNVPGGDERPDQESAHVLDQESAHVLDDPAHASYGHGTMTSGVVRLTAPGARILPLKAFGADGTGYTSDVLRAIYYAVRQRAKVMSMSFSRSTPSAELKRALDYAVLMGLVPVSSAGNTGTSDLRWPAAYDNVMGVASTADDDTRSSFSSYGPGLVFVAAPGEDVVTPYPGGRYAVVSGTSFSTPFVSGTAALLAQMNGAASYSQAAWAVSHAKRLGSDLGNGRLDVVKALGSAVTLWPRFGVSAVEGCGAAQ